MGKTNSDKELIITLVNRLLDRSGLTIERVLARMQVHGCDISRAVFENRFTTRHDLKPNIAPDCLLALVAAFSERLTEQERCKAAEALELARLARLPIDQFKTLAQYFPTTEFSAAYSHYAPLPAHGGNGQAESGTIRPQAISNGPFPGQPASSDPAGGSLVQTPLPAAVQTVDKPANAPMPAAAAWQRQHRWLVVGLSLALMIGLGLAALVFDQGRQIEAEGQATLSRRLAAQAGDHLADQVDLALLLSAAAYQTLDTFEARDSLLAALQTSPRLETFLRGHTDWVWSVAFSPDGRTLASGSADGTIRFWDVATRRLLIQPLTGHHGWVRTVAFSPDGQLLASGSADNTIILWDVSKVRESDLDATQPQPLGPPLAGHAAFITAVAFSPDGQTLASSSADGTVQLWQVATGRPLGPPLAGHTGFVMAVAFSPDGQTLASADANRSIILWDMPTIRSGSDQPLAYALTSHEGAVLSLAFSPDGHRLASGSEDKTVRLWDVAARQPAGPPLLGHTAGVNRVVFSPDGQSLASAGADRTIIYWDAATGRPLEWPFVGHTGPVLGLAFNPKAAGVFLASGSADGTIILWSAESQPLGQGLTGHADAVRSLAFSPDGQLLASGSHDFTVQLWDVAARQPLGSPLAGHFSLVSDVAFSPDGQILASASDEKTIRLWDVKSQQPLGGPLIGHQSPLINLVFSPNGRTLASSDDYQNIILWDVATRRLLSSPLPLKGRPVIFSPDGRLLAAGGQGISLWDIAGQHLLESALAGYTGEVESVAFSPDGRTLASGSHDHSIILWDVAGRRPLHQPLLGHTDWVNTVAFSPDGQLLASGSEDGTIILWETQRQQRLGLPLLNGGRVWRVAFSLDGRLLASAGRNDGVILLWDINPGSWQARACRRANRNLSLAEWERYLGDEPYRLICPEAAAPNPESRFTLPKPTATPTPAVLSTTLSLGKTPAAILEEFDSDRGFIQTHANISIENGQVVWHFERNGGEQYVYRSIPPFAGDVRLKVRGQVDSWTNNCGLAAGIGDKPGSGVAVDFGWTGGGCPTRGVRIGGIGVALDNKEDGSCNFVGNWLWVEPKTPYTAELTILDGAATLSVEGVGRSIGRVEYQGLYTTLWVGSTGRGDWPECSGAFDVMMLEPLK